MSHLWTKDADEAWIECPLEGDVVVIDAGTPARVDLPGLGTKPCDALLARTRDAHGLEQWALLCAPHGRTRVNAASLPVGIRVLADRDAITLEDGRTVFFSCERLAQIVPFPGGNDGTCCIRCKLALEHGEPAVRCPAPGCGFWHHQSDDLPCWTYTEGCAGCGHPSAFDAGYQWSPREL